MVIEIEVSVKSNIEKWNQASDDWHCPKATNDLRVEGKFIYTMASRDGKNSFDFGGGYNKVEEKKIIEYTIGDGRKVWVEFEDMGDNVKIVERFETESTNTPELQRSGWAAILNSFKSYCESN